MPRRTPSRTSSATNESKVRKPRGPKTTSSQRDALDPARQRLAQQVLKRLKADYPDAVCALEYDTAFQLLVATILSAQCTDERVNIVTKELFAKYPTAEDLARIPLKTLEKLIQSTGFFRNKAKNIKASAQALVDQHGGDVPRDLDTLVTLPGIGRKTANVVLGTAYRLATGVVVDTHVGRLSRRTGLTDETNPEKVERDLMQLFPQREWVDFAHRMIHHGRQVCIARKPRCEICSMKAFCPKIGVT
jgi:endonuclease-3